ncbi:MAG TPA: TIGR00730 family Rossman fold protein [Candidatus Acidoferrales bacterium]|nr:TIGR00730 family Rossman fold protein [Candidatus Acidoferrales bacterium]
MIRSVCVYCASSSRSPEIYLEAAARLGRALAEAGMGIVYGGSSLGSMGRMAEAALATGGKVTGVLPQFMDELEWGHRNLTELRVVDDMHERKRTMLELADAVVALPGGCGTLEELFEAITWKRLGLFFGPVVLVNVNGFFDSCVALLNRAVDERFMDEKHRAMWSVVAEPEAAPEALRMAPEWPREAREFAALR